jgi:hypothetical protein
MSVIAEKECEHPGVTRGIEAHEHDLIHELGRRLSYLWGYDRCVANASGHPALQEFWRGIKSQEQRNVAQLKKLIEQHVVS